MLGRGAKKCAFFACGRQSAWKDRGNGLIVPPTMFPANSSLRAAVAAASVVWVACLLTGCATPSAHPVADPPTADAQTDDPNALVLGAEIALERGQYLDASRALVRAAQTARDEELAERATRVAYEHRQWTLVQAAAERWLELNETNEEARRFAAFAALHLYRIDVAAEHLGILLGSAF